MDKEKFKKLRGLIARQKKIVAELISSRNYLSEGNNEERKIILQHISILNGHLRSTTEEIEEFLDKTNISKPLEERAMGYQPKKEIHEEKNPEKKYNQYEIPENIKLVEKYTKKDMKPNILEKETFKRIGKQKSIKKTEKKQEFGEVNLFVKIATKYFHSWAKRKFKKENIKALEKDLTKANIQFTGPEYISIIALSAILSIFIAAVLVLFFLNFNIGPDFPIITKSTEAFSTRIIKVFWLFLIVPIATTILMYFYPTMEKSSAEHKMNQEIPFATMHMSAIAGSMINPVKIFEIIITTKEYPNLSKQFIKLINETSIYGYDIVNALRISSENCPSKKLAELYNGLATTITSGGDLANFFEKRSESFLFEYNLEREKRTKGAETFMDMYISIVIAAPMILMILLMMVKISGLGGISLSTGTITLIMIVAVTVINIIFLGVLEAKKE